MDSMLNVVADYLLRQCWQIAALFVMVASACWLLRKASAHWRCLLWCVVLAKCLIPPALTLSLAVLPESAPAIAEELALPLVSMETQTAAVDDSFAGQGALPPMIQSDMPFPSAPAAQEASSPLTFKQWLALAWFTGACLFLAVALVKSLRLQRYLKLERQKVTGALEAEIATPQSQLRLKGFRRFGKSRDSAALRLGSAARLDLCAQGFRRVWNGRTSPGNLDA